MKDLPSFKPRQRDDVLAFIRAMLTNHTGTSYLKKLIDYPDGHFRAVFDPGYFLLPTGQQEPTKSQWNSLKKKLKRHDDKVFVFKDHGTSDCESATKCYYVDFGFFAQ